VEAVYEVSVTGETVASKGSAEDRSSEKGGAEAVKFRATCSRIFLDSTGKGVLR